MATNYNAPENPHFTRCIKIEDELREKYLNGTLNDFLEGKVPEEDNELVMPMTTIKCDSDDEFDEDLNLTLSSADVDEILKKQQMDDDMSKEDDEALIELMNKVEKETTESDLTPPKRFRKCNLSASMRKRKIATKARR